VVVVVAVVVVVGGNGGQLFGVCPLGRAFATSEKPRRLRDFLIKIQKTHSAATKETLTFSITQRVSSVKKCNLRHASVACFTQQIARHVISHFHKPVDNFFDLECTHDYFTNLYLLFRAQFDVYKRL
jgi:hypothetical protein